MLFTELAAYFERLEGTTSRNEMIGILSGLFTTATADEIDKVVYLCQGRLVPFFEPLEIGVGEKVVESALARAFELERESVRGLYDQMGDFGLVAQSLVDAKASTSTSELKLAEVYSRLDEVARVTGAGSVEQRLALLSDLLAILDARSAKYLVRITLGSLRLGIGDPTILDALSLCVAGDKSLRKPLEKAYNITSDLGLIGHTLKQEGIEGVERLQIAFGRPIRPALAERLPNAETIIAKLGEVAVEPKYDGFRVQVHKRGSDVRLYSRRLENMTEMFPEIVSATREQISAETAIFEGEAVAYNPATEEYYPFQETTKRRRKHNVQASMEELPLRLFVFDVLYLAGRDVMPLPYSERRALLEAMIEPGETLVTSPAAVLSDTRQLVAYFDDQVQRGLEGVMVKRPDSPYQAGGRNFNWVKLKRSVVGQLRDTVDCVVLGYDFGRGKRSAFGAGALLAGVYDQARDEFCTVTRIGTGLSDDEWRNVSVRSEGLISEGKPARVNSAIEPSVWLEPSLVIEVQADEITRSPLHTCGRDEDGIGYALRFPRVLGFRSDDKGVEEVTTVNEIIEMYEQQARMQGGEDTE